MKFEKGRAKTGGKQKGYVSPVTKAVRETLAYIIAEKYPPEKIFELLVSLSPKDQIQFYLQILPFVAPKLQATDISIGAKEKDERLEDMLARLAAEENAKP